MPKTTVVISADNQLKKGIDPAKKTMLEFQNLVSGIEKKISKAFTITGIATATVASIRKMTAAAKEFVSEYSAAEKVSKRLEAVWNNIGKQTGKTAREVDDLAEALEKETYFTSESIKEAGLLLAATESLTDKGFERALNVATDLAAALGEDVTSAAQTLAKALLEPESALSRLKSIGVSFTEEEKAQIKALTDANKEYEAQDIILGKIEQKYRDVAKAINDTPAGTLDNIRDVLGDIRETLGGALLNALAPALEELYVWLTKISDWIYEWGNNGVSRADQARLDAINAAAANVKKNGRITDADTYLAYYNNQDWFKANMTAAEYSKFVSDFNLLVEDYFAELEDAVSTAWNQGYVSSDRMAQLIRDDLKIEGDKINDDVREFFERILNEWETVLSPGAKAANRQAASSKIAAYLGANGSLSSSYQIASLNNQIAEAWNMHGFAVAQGDFTGASYIHEIINNLNEKLDALTAVPEEIATPTEVENILKEYGKNSNSYQLKQLEIQADRIGKAYDSASDEEKVYLDEILASNEKQRKELTEITKGSFLEAITDGLASVFEHLGFGEGQSATAAGTIIGTFTQNLGEAGEVIERLATNMASMEPALGAIVTALQYVVEGLAEVLSPILNDFVKDGIEPLRELGRVIGEILLPILEDIMPLVEASAEILMGIFNTLGVILKPIVSLISALVSPITMIITIIVQVLEPVLKFFTYALVGITTAIEWVAQGIKHIIAVVWNWFASWIPWVDGVEDPGAPGSYKDMFNANIDKINAGYEYSPVESASMSQALSSASYRGATSVTINIYAEAPIVGDGGMRQFAQMIREEFDALNYYGVTA